MKHFKVVIIFIFLQAMIFESEKNISNCVQNGTLAFVESTNILYVCVGLKWLAVQVS